MVQSGLCLGGGVVGNSLGHYCYQCEVLKNASVAQRIEIQSGKHVRHNDVRLSVLEEVYVT